MAGFGSAREQSFGSVGRAQYFRDNMMGMSAYERHKLMMSDYMKYYGGAAVIEAAGGMEAYAAARRHGQLRQTDSSALREGHRFIRTAEDDASDSLPVRLAKKYYDRLFKEYCIADLSRYKESKIGMRWRTQKEVVAGKGQFVCGAKGCDAKDGLCSYEVNFAYEEAGQRKQALVKLRVCPECAVKLNWKREKEFRKAQAKALQHAAKGAAGGSGSGAGAGSSKRGRASAADFFGGEGEGCGRHKAARGAGYDQGEDKDWVAPPPGQQQQQAQQAAQAAGQGQAAQASVLPADDKVWESKPVQEATVEEEFEQYFEGMFL